MRPLPSRRLRAEQGSASVHVCTLLALLTSTALGVLMVAAAVTAGHKAAAAADLAALAAASARQQGGNACDAAARIAAANSTVLRRCVVRGQEVTVEVEVDVSTVLGSWTFSQRARAGPA